MIVQLVKMSRPTCLKGVLVVFLCVGPHTQNKFVEKLLLSRWNIKTEQILRSLKLEFHTILSVNRFKLTN